MKRLSLLSRNIKIKNRKGKIEYYPLSVLQFICSEDCARRICNIPDMSCIIEASSIEIVPYSSEIPFTLQTDASIIIDIEQGLIEFLKDQY